MSKLFYTAAIAIIAAAPVAAYTLPAGPASTRAPSQAASIGKPQVANMPAVFVTNEPMPFVMAELVVNGSFETGDFSGWQQVNDTSFTFVTDEAAGGGPTDGTFHAAFGPTDPGGGGILQDVATVAGGVYTLSFDLANLSGGANAFGLFWDGSFVFIDFELDAFDYETLTGNLVASGSTTTLGFIFYNEPSFFLLDNISLTSARGIVPEPATWAMMIAGFGLVGTALRRRRTAIA